LPQQALSTPTNIIICDETAAEFWPYASTAPNILQISAFLNSQDGLLKCVDLKVLMFQMSPSDKTP
jgi:hypothetical protein